MFILATIITLTTATQAVVTNLQPAATSTYESFSAWAVKTYDTAYTLANTK